MPEPDPKESEEQFESLASLIDMDKLKEFNPKLWA